MCSIACTGNRTRNGKVRSLDVISCVDKFSKGEEKVLKETSSWASRTHILIGIPPQKEFKISDRVERQSRLWKKSWEKQRSGHCFIYSGAVTSHTCQKAKTAFLKSPPRTREVEERQCEMLPKSHRGRTTALGKAIPIPKWGQIPKGCRLRKTKPKEIHVGAVEQEGLK